MKIPSKELYLQSKSQRSKKEVGESMKIRKVKERREKTDKAKTKKVNIHLILIARKQIILKFIVAIDLMLNAWSVTNKNMMQEFAKTKDRRIDKHK